MDILKNIRKTLAYARRNGVKETWRAVRERIVLNRMAYRYETPATETLRAQRVNAQTRAKALMKGDRNKPSLPRFSILVPLYRTPPTFLKAMINSVTAQSYGEWELILADASPAGESLEKLVAEISPDRRVRYLPLLSNDGIAANTNIALNHAEGDYVCLLDHDDMLTPDALYELEQAISAAGTENISSDEGNQEKLRFRCVLIYSDEDKCTDDGGNLRFFEPHFKPDFDFDRLLSNNYICHLTAIRTDVAKLLKLRPQYDGSQDYDLILRACGEVIWRDKGGYRHPDEVRARIRHVPKVLYHWRSHRQSTATNPSSKTYAYEAGKRAINDFLKTHGIAGVAKALLHLGFYRIDYTPDVLTARPDIGAVGGKLLDRKGRISGGAMDAQGKVLYEGLPKGYSGGYQHPAVLQQEVAALDLRCLRVRSSLHALYEEAIGIPYEKAQVTLQNWDEKIIRARSLEFCAMLRQKGYRLLWDPAMENVCNKKTLN